MTSSVKLKGTLLFIASLTVMAGAIIAPSLPSISQHLIASGVDQDVAAFWTRMFLSIPAFFVMLAGPLVGYLIDRYERLKVLKIGLVVYALTGVWAGIYPTLLTLILSRIGLGCAIAMSMVTAVTLISDYFKGEERVKVFALFTMSLSIGGIFYFMIGGLAASLYWRLPFFVYLFSIPALLAAHYFLKEPERHSETYIHESGEVLPLRHIFMIYATAMLHMAIYFVIPIQLPFVLFSQGITSPMMVAVATSCCSLGVVVTSLQYTKFRHFVRFSSVYTLTFLLKAIGISFIFFFQSYAMICLGLFLAGCGFGFTMPNHSTWLFKIVPSPYRGRVSGGMSSSINLGQFLSPLVSYPIVEAYSSREAFLFFAGISLFVSLFYLFYGWFSKD